MPRSPRAPILLSLLLLAGCGPEQGVPTPSPAGTPSPTPSPTPPPGATPSSTAPPQAPTPTATATAPEGEAVEILIDDQGIPHIFAQSDEGLFYAAGYQMAVDRLYQMESLRRFALGRLAEVLGEDTLILDALSRAFRIAHFGATDWEVVQAEDPELAGLLRAWVRGINKRIAEVRSGAAPLPLGYGPEHHDFLPEPWDEADPCIVLKGAGYALDMTLEFELALSFVFGLYPEPMSHIEILKPAHPVYSVPESERPPGGEDAGGMSTAASPHLPEWIAKAGLDDPARLTALLESLGRLRAVAGSNNWALGGEHTATGRPLLAGDPHLSFGFFGAPYPMHLNSRAGGGTFNVAGFAFAGTPGIAIGHNEDVIWSPTSAFGDTMDVWFVEERQGRINLGGDWTPIDTWEEPVLVRQAGGPVGAGETAMVPVASVEGYGVMLPGAPFGETGYMPILNNWMGFQGRPVRWFMALNRVDSIDAFEAAVDSMDEMNYNFLGASATDISFRVGLDIPARGDIGEGRAPWLLMDATDPESLWTGEVLPDAALPRSRGEGRGYLGTANNDPFAFTDDGDLQNDPFFYGALFAPGYRAMRIEESLAALSAEGDVTLEDMLELQMDTRSPLADGLLPLLAAAHDHIGQDPDLEDLAGDADLDAFVALVTEGWDHRMERESPGALAFFAYTHFLTAEALRDDIPLAFDLALALQTIYIVKVADLALRGGYSDGEALLQGGIDRVLLDAARQTASWLKVRFGSIDPPAFTYGDLKVTRFDEAYGYDLPLFSAPTDGGEDTLNVGQNITFGATADAFVTGYVSVERMVGTFNADGTPEAWVTYPVGPHADPTSDDTQRANHDYIEGNYRKIPFTRDEVDAALRERRVLSVPQAAP